MVKSHLKSVKLSKTRGVSKPLIATATADRLAIAAMCLTSSSLQPVFLSTKAVGSHRTHWRILIYCHVCIYIVYSYVLKLNHSNSK